MAKYITLIGRCSTTSRKLGIQFECGKGFVAVGSFSVSAESDSSEKQEHTGKIYAGTSFKCRYCGNNSILQCGCGIVSCIKPNEKKFTCPACGQNYDVVTVSIDELKAGKINTDKQ